MSAFSIQIFAKMLDMELGDSEEGNPGYAPGESLPSTPLKDGEQPKNKAKPKRSNKRHRQGNGGGTMPKIWAI